MGVDTSVPAGGHKTKKSGVVCGEAWELVPQTLERSAEFFFQADLGQKCASQHG